MDAQTLDYLGQLLRLADQERLSELHIEQAGVAIRISRRRARPAPPQCPAPRRSPPAPAPARSGLIYVRSPLLGIFYRAAGPDEPPYVQLGETVEVGQTIGLVEAMKVFNEIATDVAGRVAEIPAENGQLVHAGDALIALEPIAS